MHHKCNTSLIIATYIRESFIYCKSKFIYIRYSTFLYSIKNMSCSLRTISSKNTSVYIFIIISPTNSSMSYKIIFCFIISGNIIFTKSIYKFFSVIFIFIIRNCYSIIIFDSWLNFITNRHKGITSNTKRFKFSTTHNIFLIFSLVNKIITTTTITNTLNNIIHNIITCIDNIFKLRLTGVLFKSFIRLKNTKHIIKYTIVTSLTTILFFNTISFTKFFTTKKTILLCSIS